jgi:hypothetical protein
MAVRLILSWSPQRRRVFICKRLLALAGWRVNPRRVADQWLEPMKEHLAGLRHIPEEEREEALTRWLDKQLRSDPDSHPLVKGMIWWTSESHRRSGRICLRNCNAPSWEKASLERNCSNALEPLRNAPLIALRVLHKC